MTRKIWLIILYITLLIESKESWSIKGVGEVQHVHFVHENDNVTLKGICVASSEGILALLNPGNGQFIWRHRIQNSRTERLRKFIPSKNYGLCLFESFGTVIDFHSGDLLSSVNFNTTHLIDGYFTTVNSKDPPHYTIMTDRRIATFSNSSEIWSLSAPKNEIFIGISLHPILKVPILVSSTNGTCRISLANNALEPLIVPFNCSVLHMNGYMVMGTPDMETVVLYNTNSHTLSNFKADIDRGRKIRLNWGMLVVEDWKEYAIMSVKAGTINKVYSVSRANEYAFGMDESGFYVCQSNSTGYKVTFVQYTGKPKVVYENGTDLNKKIYGEPEMVWGKEDIVVIKSKDGSLHLVQDGVKKWTKPFGLWLIMQVIEHNDGFIVLANKSKIAYISSKNDELVWERTSTGHISNMHLRRNGESLALVIENRDQHRTKIVELLTKTGERLSHPEIYDTISYKTQPLWEDSIMIINMHNQAIYTYPKNNKVVQEIATHRKGITFYDTTAQKDAIVAYKPTIDGQRFSQVWNMSFSKLEETIIFWERGSALRHTKSKLVTVSGKEFNPLIGMEETLLVVTTSKRNKRLCLYLIDAQRGVVYSVFSIYEAITNTVPTFYLYENMLLIGLHYENAKDRIVLIDLCTASEIADTKDYKSGRIGNKKEKEMAYLLKTVLELDWKFLGLSMYSYDGGKDHIAVVDKEGEVNLIDPSKFAKGETHKIAKKQLKTVKTNGKVEVNHPIKAMMYTERQKELLVVGGDIYLLKLNN